ncbi:Glycine cleavage system transcriptional activator [compost metagenome]
MYQLPPIQCLIAFDARARLGSGVLAARELCITPSALSHRLKQLEDFTNIQLFSKASGESILTAAGENYLEIVREALGTLSSGHAQGGRQQRKAPQKIRLCSPPTFATQILVPRLAEIQDRFPTLALELHLSVPLVGTKAEEADIEIRFGKGNYPGYLATPILKERVFPVCSPAYLEAHGGFSSANDMLRGRLLRCVIEPWAPWLEAAGLQDTQISASGIQFVDIGLFVEAAACGHGIALARPMMIDNLLNSGRLVPAFAMSARPVNAYYATCVPETMERPEVSQFMSWLEASLHTPAYPHLQAA